MVTSRIPGMSQTTFMRRWKDEWMTAATVAGGMRERSGTSESEGGFNADRPRGCGRPTDNRLMGLQLLCDPNGYESELV